MVYFDGYVENLSKFCSVYDFFLGNLDYYVCGSIFYIIINCMVVEEVFEYGVIYFVCVMLNV